MTEVVSIESVKPNTETVEILEDLLKLAKEGKLRGIAAGLAWITGKSSRVWVSDPELEKMLGYEVNLLNIDLSACALAADEFSGISEIIKDYTS